VAAKSKVCSVLPGGNPDSARCLAMRRVARSASSCSQREARKRAEPQPSLSARAPSYVLITRSTGSTAQLGDFATEADAVEWVNVESAAWLKTRQTGSHD
jgi:hypothetical protein